MTTHPRGKPGMVDESFNIGDRVRVIKDETRPGSINLLGREGVVDRIDGNAYRVTGNGWGGWFESSQLAHVEES